MDNLAANPKGGSGIANQPGSTGMDSDPLGYVNAIKDREMVDFKNKANFMSDLSLKQERMRAMFDPSRLGLDDNKQTGQAGQPGQGGQNVVLGQDPNAMTGYEKGELGVRQQQLGVEKDKLKQQGKLGQEALDIKGSQEKLNQEKSDQIHKQKIDELTAKQEDFRQKLELAQKALTDKNAGLDKQLELHKTIAENTKAFHDAEMAKKDLDFARKEAEHKDAMKVIQDKLKAASSTHQVRRDAQGNEITTDTQRGDAIGQPIKNSDGTYTVTAPDGTKGKIPANKLDHWMQNHQPGQDQQDNQGGDDGAS